MGKTKTPDFMPILSEKMARGGYEPTYEEREITSPVLLCDEKGQLNPEAVGWSRMPLVTANLRGHWLRKKKWNFWNWISPKFVFSVTIADIDLASMCAVSFIDFETHESLDKITVRPHGWVTMPDRVREDIHFQSKSLRVDVLEQESAIKVSCRCHKRGGRGLAADFVSHRPTGHETLNVVVPWTRDRFQLNSKANTLPTAGFIEVGEKRYIMDPEECHGVQDFGRGIWPYRTYWNWGACTGKQDGRLLGVNMGGKWTTGTGANENGLCLDGRLTKIMEDLVWTHDEEHPMDPWRVQTAHSKVLDMTLTPFYERRIVLDLILIGTRGVCVFGLWEGAIEVDGQTIEIHGLPGWVEDFAHKW